ncbi:MAG: hypothetical protein HUU22_03325 [Phycisphaerae bacterium]|nr:hypothetical protein [Phycisphaerae bacterium]
MAIANGRRISGFIGRRMDRVAARRQIRDEPWSGSSGFDGFTGQCVVAQRRNGCDRFGDGILCECIIRWRIRRVIRQIDAVEPIRDGPLIRRDFTYAPVETVAKAAPEMYDAGVSMAGIVLPPWAAFGLSLFYVLFDAAPWPNRPVVQR